MSYATLFYFLLFYLSKMLDRDKCIDTLSNYGKLQI